MAWPQNDYRNAGKDEGQKLLKQLFKVLVVLVITSLALFAFGCTLHVSFDKHTHGQGQSTASLAEQLLEQANAETVKD